MQNNTFPGPPPPPPATHQLPPLPPGWTQHTAPTGHAYYYNASTKKSTYKRPGSFPSPPPPPPQLPTAVVSPAPIHYNPYNPQPFGVPQSFYSSAAPDVAFPANNNYDNRSAHRVKKPHPPDRPKSKQPIPNCSPWVVVRTKLRRRFVHNPETGQSLWTAPKYVLEGLVELDLAEARRKGGEERGERDDKEDTKDIDAMDVDVEVEQSKPEQTEETAITTAPAVSTTQPPVVAKEGQADDSDEYEEVEVTDSEAEVEEGEADDDNNHTTDSHQQPTHMEFTEADIADQLAQMGEAYDLDPGEYGVDYYEDEDGAYVNELEDGAEGLPLTDAEAHSAFHALLSDLHIDPYTTFDNALATAPSIVDDPRYTFLPSTKARRAAFASWSQAAIAALKAAKAAAPRRDPQADFLALLDAHASPKLYWAEFRRKHRKEATMRDSALADREREKLYRDHVGRVTRLSEEQRRAELEKLLRGVRPGEGWNADVRVDVVSGEGVPLEVRRDVKWISVPRKARGQVVKKVVEGLPKAKDVAE